MRRKTRKLERRGECDVYWGGHGCHKQKGHKGRHFCSHSCGPPENWMHFYGDDIDLYPQPCGDPKEGL